MHSLQACLFEYITVAAFCISQCGENAAKREGWRPCTTLSIVENHGIVFLNFCGNPEIYRPKQTV